MKELSTIIERVTRALHKHEVKYVVVGGVAAIIKGKARTTMDVDIIIEDDMPKVFLFLSTLKNEGFDVSPEQARIGFALNEDVPVFDTRSVLRLDLKIARTDDEVRVLENGELDAIEGIPLRVAKPEFILFGKVWFLGDVSDLDDAELLQFNDVQDFINVVLENKDIDMKLLETLVQEKKLMGTLNRLLDLVEKVKIPE
ncbi:MAG: hypothetical protein JW839_06070 [Candidatus Lokiarchaeota archaeon]|nr:hypothetical protein [Candidatus Lokiarchaeota archaeon]